MAVIHVHIKIYDPKLNKDIPVLNKSYHIYIGEPLEDRFSIVYDSYLDELLKENLEYELKVDKKPVFIKNHYRTGDKLTIEFGEYNE